jgi:hypothetical protein
MRANPTPYLFPAHYRIGRVLARAICGHPAVEIKPVPGAGGQLKSL